jgi:hypothetical protein
MSYNKLRMTIFLKWSFPKSEHLVQATVYLWYTFYAPGYRWCVMGWMVSPKKIYPNPNPRFFLCDLIWKQGFCSYNERWREKTIPRWVLNPTSCPYKRQKVRSRHRGDDHVKTDGEIGAMQPQAKDSQQKLEEEGFSPWVQREHGSDRFLDFWPLELWENNFYYFAYRDWFD